MYSQIKETAPKGEVSVPFTGILFFNKSLIIGKRKRMTFPSPSRGSYFSIIHYRIVRCWWIFVSVPFLGILFLNVCADVASAVKLISFRPLHGDLISQSFEDVLKKNNIKYVSVPFTGILFLNGVAGYEIQNRPLVSVPFPGILFLNCHKEKTRILSFADVSVPFPGILFLNQLSTNYI